MAGMPRSLRLLSAMLLLGALVSACGGGGTDESSPPPPPPPAPPPPPPPPPSAPVATVTVSPPADTVIIKATLQLAAAPKDSAGNALTGRPITWTVTDPALASVSASGQVTALLPGVVGVVATAEQKSDTASLTLVPLLTLAPRLPSLFVGDTVHVTASLKDALGGAVVGSVSWTSRQPTRATVTAGVVTAVDTGRVTIVASGTAIAESVVVAVLQPRSGVNREIAYLTDSARTDGQQIPTLRLYLPGGAPSVRVSAFDEYVNEYAWSADGARLVFSYLGLNGVGRSGMWAANADGTAELQLGPPGSHPRWSPDGSRIAYRGSTNPAKIIVAQANGSGSQTITSGAGDDLDPEWSPDGRQLVFRRQTTFCEQMWIMDADGTHARQVQVPVLTCRFQWSPDGKLIVIEGFTKPYSGVGGVWVVRPDGTGFRAASSNCDDTGACTSGGPSGANWSPDGTQLVFAREDGWIYRWSRASGTVVDSFQLAQFCCSTVGGVAQWSPDGTTLLYLGPYVYQPLGAVQPLIGIMNPDGTGQVPVIDFHIAQGSPSWRP